MPRLTVTPTFVAAMAVIGLLAGRHARETEVVDAPEVPSLPSTPTPEEMSAWLDVVNDFDYPRYAMPWGWVLVAGVGAALIFALSIVAHELGHLVVAKLAAADVTGLTLHAAGGFVELAHDGRLSRAEFSLIVVAGPLVTAILAAAGWVLMGVEWPDGPGGIVADDLVPFLVWTNALALVVNLLPIRGLDGWLLLRGAVR
ncbi:M50 family metallopeptidase [Solirubrobacter sp. CPCC 204708]|uniref:M50 family metallopeptidase n=1 Tax=Solirubrobacter deserti TaxID=2282478 RepID=A0ABT4RUB6_9ACTN|nr:site-2 protease family protein [Solirubrobacter deserti]MBE2320759.1 M50 family metallopeptidase [Solirubrobacter deserti]MDA0141861.1 M50 family metallopeptidase [Solirubrobacter deserti]